MHAKELLSCLILCDLMDDILPGSSILGILFSRQEYWSVLPYPSPGHLPDPGIKPGSSAWQADSLPSKAPITTLSKIFVNKEYATFRTQGVLKCVGLAFMW